MNKALAIYIDQINYRRSFFSGCAPLDVYYDHAELRELIYSLGDPAILSGDGEYTREETESRTNEWIDAMTELDWIGVELAA